MNIELTVFVVDIEADSSDSARIGLATDSARFHCNQKLWNLLGLVISSVS